MERSRPNPGEEPINRRQFLKKLTLGGAALGIAGVTGLNILKIEKLQNGAWRREILEREIEILEREIECRPLGFIRDENKISKSPQDWVPEEVEDYMRDKRNALIAGATTEAAIAYLAFGEEVVSRGSSK